MKEVKKPTLKPCPVCGKVPEIDFNEDDSWSPRRKTFGRKAIAFTTGHSGCNISASGSAVLWASYNREMMYTPEEWYATQDRAEAICTRKWNKAVNKWNREKEK